MTDAAGKQGQAMWSTVFHGGLAGTFLR
ncbi:MAG: hypothetical protein QOE85_1957, partial [Actinomycetota bacterium]|nr:hypothetical protein [Actinomycetota bacterium]